MSNNELVKKCIAEAEEDAETFLHYIPSVGISEGVLGALTVLGRLGVPLDLLTDGKRMEPFIAWHSGDVHFEDDKCGDDCGPTSYRIVDDTNDEEA